jgi:beta-N-acetylhexosaminidase
VSGTSLTSEEAELLRAQPPAGVILFARNVDHPTQLRALTRQIRDLLGADAVIMVDQEGGRVARLRPPHWHTHPPAAAIGGLYARDAAAGLRAAWLTGALIGEECVEVGINVVCAPVLDLYFPTAHDIIGDRAFAADPTAVSALGQAFAEGLASSGAQPVAKHIPGHGQAKVDSHHALPVVPHLSNNELQPFRHNATLPWAMTAHIVYPAWDSNRPATLSPIVVERVIREMIGFRGILVSDDLTMKALQGEPGALTKQALAAGCDLVLHCSGVLEESRAVLNACPPMPAFTRQRLQTASAEGARSKTQRDPAPLLLARDRLLA